jgi:hypothetical protein
MGFCAFTEVQGTAIPNRKHGGVGDFVQQLGYRVLPLSEALIRIFPGKMAGSIPGCME